MPAITLPPSLHNSFWSQDFRTGLAKLFQELEKGCEDNQAVVALIQAQATTYRALSNLPSTPASPSPPSSTLHQTILTLSSASSAQSRVYHSASLELERNLLDGFRRWAAGHRARLEDAREEVIGLQGDKSGETGSLVGEWEELLGLSAKLKQTYLSKARIADDAEEDVKFAPTNAAASTTVPPPGSTPTNPRLSSLRSPTGDSSSGGGLKRTGTVSERISEKLRAASLSKAEMPIPTSSSPPPEFAKPKSDLLPAQEIRTAPPSSMPQWPATTFTPSTSDSPLTSPMPDMRPPPILFGGLSLPFEALISLLLRFAHYVSVSDPPNSNSVADANSFISPKTAVGKRGSLGRSGSMYGDASKVGGREELAPISRTKTTILGTYDGCFSGGELVAYLVENVEGFGGDWVRAETAGAELLKWGMIGRIGVGRGWESSSDVFYVLKEAAFDSSPFAIEALRTQILSETKPTLASGLMSPVNTSALPSLATATTMMRHTLSSFTNGSPTSSEPAHVRARKEAKRADGDYREAMEQLERLRLRLEERIDVGLRQWERWERERLANVKHVLKQYEGIIKTLPVRLQAAQEPVGVAVEAFQPDADLLALIESNRTGPFRPHPLLYETLDSDEIDVNFGIDLRRWAGEHGWAGERGGGKGREKDAVPGVLEALLKGLDLVYASVSDDQKRKSWIYEVPLVETHKLRELINDPRVPVADMINEIKQYNAPVVAATIKLWLLELNPPLLGHEAYEHCQSMYPSVGVESAQVETRTEEVKSVLGRLPGPQLFVLNALVVHLRKLIEGTKSEAETDEVYLTKLSLSLGHTILRPNTENEFTMQNRTSSHFFADLLNSYSTVLPALLERRMNEQERPVPVRKRTAPTDRRISRSKLERMMKEDEEDLVQVGTRELAMQKPADHPSPAAAPATVGRVELRDEPAKTPPPAAGEDAPVLAPPIETTQPALEVSIPAPSASAPSAIIDTPMSAGESQFSRPKSMVKDDAPLAEGAATLARSGSGENARLRGPRVAGARPRPAGARVPSASYAAAGNINIRDRIAQMENADS